MNTKETFRREAGNLDHAWCQQKLFDSVRNPHLQHTLIASLGPLWTHNGKGGTREKGYNGITLKLGMKGAVTLFWSPLSSERRIPNAVVTSTSSPCTGDV